MKKEIFTEIPLTGCVEQAPEMVVRLQCTEIARGGLGFVFDILKNGNTVLSAGMLQTEGALIAAYLKKTQGRKPVFAIYEYCADAWDVDLLMTLYTWEGSTRADGGIWVEGGAVWVGYFYDKQLISCAKLDMAQLIGLCGMADAMEAAFGVRE